MSLSQPPAASTSDSPADAHAARRRALSDAALIAAAACFLVGAGITVADVLLRSMMGRNVPAAIEITTFAIGLGALISMPVCYARHEHVTARLLSEMQPNRFARPLGRFGAGVSVIFAAVMAAMIGANTLSKWGSPETTRDTGLPMDMVLAVVTLTLVVAFMVAVWAFGALLRRGRQHG